VGEFIWETVLYVIVRIAVASAIIAVISYAYQVRKTKKDLMMTKQEVKDERKQAEIDPHVKSARRALAMRLMQRQMLDSVPTADVVVTNPTHFAVALKYERGKDRAPVVLAKGRDMFARRIKALATEHGVPFVENKPVARALFKYGQVGREIPAQLYQVVAEILSFVYRTHRYYFHRLKARRLGQTA
jgi:flagellar biosynthetic protein FlhB